MARSLSPIFPFFKILAAFITGILLYYSDYTSYWFLKITLVICFFSAIISYLFYQNPYLLGAGWIAIACYGGGMAALTPLPMDFYPFFGRKNRNLVLTARICGQPVSREGKLFCDLFFTYRYDGKEWEPIKWKEQIIWTHKEPPGPIGSYWVVTYTTVKKEPWAQVKKATFWFYSGQKKRYFFTPYLQNLSSSYKKRTTHKQALPFLAFFFNSDRYNPLFTTFQLIRKSCLATFTIPHARNGPGFFSFFLMGLIFFLLLFLGSSYSKGYQRKKKRTIFLWLVHGWFIGAAGSLLNSLILLAFLLPIGYEKLIKRQHWQSLSITIFLALLWNPLSFLSPEFHFFYGTIFAILLAPSLSSYHNRCSKKNVLKNHLAQLLVNILFVQITILPLFRYHLGYIPTYFLLESLLLTFFLLPTGILACMSYVCPLFPSSFWSLLSSFFFASHQAISNLPGAIIVCPTYENNLLELFLYYVLFTLLLLFFRQRERFYFYLIF